MTAGYFPFRKRSLFLVCTGLFLLLITSCTVVKKYPRNRPFVYKTNINVIGNFSNEEKSSLNSRLKDQLDDSMKARSVSKILWNVMKNPPAYDSASAGK